MGQPDRNNLRATLLPGADEELMSFDRLEPDPELYAAITVRAVGNGRCTALHVQPTLTLGPMLAPRLLRIDGLEDAIDRSELMAPDRRDFLKSRIGYWKDWARSEGLNTFAQAMRNRPWPNGRVSCRLLGLRVVRAEAHRHDWRGFALNGRSLRAVRYVPYFE